MNFDESIAFLESRIRLGIRPGTERVRALMELLDDPQLTYPTIHVTGTNGKYSVVRMVDAILQASGLRVGTYTSPHVEHYTERIAVDGAGVTEDEFAQTLDYLKPFIELVEARADGELTHFELLTAMAFEHFAQVPVHTGVFEVGLGGEYDATNLIHAAVSVITRIDRDHIPQFGEDLTRVAWEKAGVIKEGSIALSGVTDAAQAAIITERARERGASRLALLGQDFAVLERRQAVGGQLLSVRGLEDDYTELFVPILGAHQASNVAFAVAACEAFGGGRLDADAVRAALADVRLPARLEIAGRHPMVVLEGGHNPDAARATVAALADEFVYDRLYAVVGMLEDKLVTEVLQILAPVPEMFIVTTAPWTDRAARPERLAGVLDDAGVGIGRVVVEPDPLTALQDALERAHDEDLVLVFGSLTLAGALRPWLRERASAPHT